ncbi:DUF5020 family protein [Bacteroides sp. 214]|uniref:nucleoside-specific channel-forming Tsx family protein n=1 Tax=Bacteroides sp. 214 TaxID=2302935 RepID=UPI0013D6298C|nr:DUF5020 family protein [Bacteroides sp. 214]NDW13334.1 DUF5020 family protein [Bacteroides sp. 214]
MRKILLTLAISLLLTPAATQNIQLHYDFGRSIYDKDLSERPRFTTTVEHFKPDRWGSTFFFVDMDYADGGITSAYWEIARELTFWKGPLSAHIEYNGGLAKGFSFNNAWLVGPTYTFNNSTYSAGFTFSAMYKHIQKHHSKHNFQFTATWYKHLADGLYTFSGFADWWREVTPYGKLIFMTEPQFWLNLNKLNSIPDDFNLSIGTEVEVTNNFVNKGWYVIPTLAVKWTL